MPIRKGKNGRPRKGPARLADGRSVLVDGIGRLWHFSDKTTLSELADEYGLWGLCNMLTEISDSERDNLTEAFLV